MATHKSAEKAYRQSIKRNKINSARMSRIRTFIKKLEAAIAAKDEAGAKEAFKKAQSEIMRGVKKNIVTKNSASRKISRLSAKVKGIKKAA